MTQVMTTGTQDSMICKTLTKRTRTMKLRHMRNMDDKTSMTKEMTSSQRTILGFKKSMRSDSPAPSCSSSLYLQTQSRASMRWPVTPQTQMIGSPQLIPKPLMQATPAVMRGWGQSAKDHEHRGQSPTSSNCHPYLLDPTSGTSMNRWWIIQNPSS
jgi:hypothetical protein